MNLFSENELRNRYGHQPLLALLVGAVLVGLGWSQGGWEALVGAPIPSVYRDASIGRGILVMGLGLLVAGLGGAYRDIRFGAGLVERADAPWLADYPWSPVASQAAGSEGLFYRFLMVGTLGLVGWPSFASVLSGETSLGDPEIGFFLVLLGSLWLGAAVYLVYVGLRWLNFGSPHFRFERFPFFLGEAVEGRLQLDAPIEARSLRLTLRCQQEFSKSGGTMNDHHTVVGARTLHAEVRDVVWDPQAETVDLPLSFSLPEDPKLETELSAGLPRYWELVVEAETPGPDLRVVLLVPVYRRPG